MKIVGATGLGGLWALEWAWHINTQSCAAYKATKSKFDSPIFYFHVYPFSICFRYLPCELEFFEQIDKKAPRVRSKCLVSLGHLFVLLVVHQRPSYIGTKI